MMWLLVDEAGENVTHEAEPQPLGDAVPRARSLRRSTLVVVGYAISVVGLWLAVRGVSWPAVLASWRHVSWGLLCLSFCMSAAGLALVALRWKIILGASQRVPFAPLFRATCIGYLANNILPAKMGEVVRAYFLRSQHQVTASRTMGSIVCERACDVASILVLLFLAPFYLRQELPVWVERLQWPCLVLVVAGFLGGVASSSWIARLERRDSPPRWLQSHLGWKLAQIASGMEAFRNIPVLFVALLLSLTMWAYYGLVYWVALMALHADVGISAGLFIAPAAGAAMAVPSAPAGLGTFELAVVTSLMLFGLTQSSAVGAAATLHVVSFLPQVAIGIVLLVLGRIPLDFWRHIAVEAEPSGHLEVG